MKFGNMEPRMLSGTYHPVTSLALQGLGLTLDPKTPVIMA